MPEYSYTLKQPEPVVPPRKPYRESKYWIRAKRRYNNKHMQITNECTEWEYHRLIKEVKKLFVTRNEYVFERDYKSNRESLFTMHEFQCESVFLQLWCCFSEFYFVDFDFHNCPFEQEIRQHFSKGMLYTQNRHFPLDPGFFSRTQENQDKSFFYNLKVQNEE
jgi:hypothetical protein